jgi:xanthine phosphoribosyltransferase
VSERAEFEISKRKLDRDIAFLVERLAANAGRWRAVIGVANGGIYPAGKVADQLGLEYREIRISSYNGKSKSQLEIVRMIDDTEQGHGFLIIDDVVDSGGTALAIHQILPRADFISIYAKSEGLRKVQALGQWHRYVEQYPQDLWLVFPWDQKNWADEVPLSVAEYRRNAGT